MKWLRLAEITRLVEQQVCVPTGSIQLFILQRYRETIDLPSLVFFPVFLGRHFREFQGIHCFFFFFLLFLELDLLFGGKGINLKWEIDFCVKIQPFCESVSKVSSLNFCPNLDYTTPDAWVSLSQDRILSKYFSNFPNSHMLIFFPVILLSWILPRQTFWSYSVRVPCFS